MVNPNFYTLLGQGSVPVDWFEAQLTRYKTSSDTLRDDYLSPEVTNLMDFHNGTLSATQAASAITRPITTNPVPSVGSSSDETVAVIQLWRLYKDALVEWPSNYTKSLVSLGVAISELPDKLHRGEALDDEEDDQARKPLAWKNLPCIHMVWRDAHWQQPRDLVDGCKGQKDRQHARDVYLKQQDVEAQLVASDIFKYKLAFRAVVTDLEIARVTDDPNLEPLEADFHIPAAARWINQVGQRMYTSIVEKHLGDLDENDLPKGARHFDKPADRWRFWEGRFREFAEHGPDDFTKGEAATAVRKMREISGSS